MKFPALMALFYGWFGVAFLYDGSPIMALGFGAGAVVWTHATFQATNGPEWLREHRAWVRWLRRIRWVKVDEPPPRTGVYR